MAVNINTVYQKVLSLSNKEQRGYITPQEFNLFADQAQKEIFEQYFYDLNQFKRIPGNDTDHSDMVALLNDKLSFFSKFEVLTSQSTGLNAQQFNIPDDFYRFQDARTSADFNSVKIEKLNKADAQQAYTSALTKGTNTRPIMYLEEEDKQIWVQSDNEYWNGESASPITSITLQYYKKPTSPSWAYNIINQKPFYNSTNSTNFELHLSDESELVYRILFMAGVAIEKPQLSQAAAALQTSSIQQEKQ